MKIAMSSGHAKHVRGARGSPVPPELDEVDEARRVVEGTAAKLRAAGVECVTFHDDVSMSQSENLSRIVDWHNKQKRDTDCSIHFNAFDSSAHGCEVLYVTQQTLASVMASAIADAGPFTNRGAKYRSDLAFLNGTDEPAVLVEVCFCDHTGDSNNYRANYEAICEAIAESISGADVPPDELPPESPDVPVGCNRVDITTVVSGDVTTYVNGTLIRGHEPCEHKVEYTVSLHGDVTLVVNGEEFHNNLGR
jgi:N-acetylmuramoyl-L-alanine amidase